MLEAYIENDGVVGALRDRHHAIASAKVTRQQNAIDSFKFTIYPNHPSYRSLLPFTTLVKVVDASSGKARFDGRVLSAAPSMDSKGLVCSEVTCAGVMGYLNDSRQGYAEERQWSGDGSRTGMQAYVDAVLERHNSMVEPHKRIYRGDVTLATHETSDGVFKGFQRESSLDALVKKLADVYGGEQRVRRDGAGLLRFDYAERLGQVRSTPIALGHNMQSASRSLAFDEVVTRLWPLGKKLDGSDDRLTVSSVNGGLEYIDDAELQATYGIIGGTETWDDVEVPSNLLAKGREFLAAKRAVAESTKITALDLSLIGIDPDEIQLYDWYPCRNELIGLDATLEVVKQVIDISEPHKSTYEFGTLSRTQTWRVRAMRDAVRAAAESAAAAGSVSAITTEWIEQNIN